MARRPGLVMIDRDGVINEDSGDFIKSVAEWRPIAGSLEAIAALHRAAWRVAVVTNQSGVGRGLYDEATLAKIHRAHARARGRGRRRARRHLSTALTYRTPAANAASRSRVCFARSSASSACR